MECMENPETNQTPAEPMNTDDVLEIATTEDLKYLAAIGLRALAAYEAAGDNEIDGGDHLQTVGQAVGEASVHAARPEFLPTAE